jgi:hypothetical protein
MSPLTGLRACLAVLLTPLLLAGTAGDAAQAREAAAEALSGTPDDAVPAAQALALTIASIDSLRLSMQPELPLPLTLRLRASGNALARTAIVTTGQGTKPAAPSAAPKSASASAPNPAPAPGSTSPASTPPAAPVTSPATWAAAMIEEATLRQNDPSAATPAQRTINEATIQVLHQVAAELMLGQTQSRAALLSGTAIGLAPTGTANSQVPTGTANGQVPTGTAIGRVPTVPS